jgi:hypothetical protein
MSDFPEIPKGAGNFLAAVVKAVQVTGGQREWRLVGVRGLRLYRQPGGCLEIGQDDSPDNDLVHVCDGDVADFYRLLGVFIEQTEPEPEPEPEPETRCEGSCDCSVGICNEPSDAWCDHCPVHCDCPVHGPVSK